MGAPGRPGQSARHRRRGVGVAAHVDGGEDGLGEVAVGGGVRAEGQGDGLGGQVRPGVAADDDRRAHRPFAAVRDRDRAAQRAGRPGVVRDHRERGGGHGERRGTRHRRRDARRDRLAAVDALAVMAHRTVDRHQARGLRGTPRREHAEGGRAHRQAVAPRVPVLGRDGGRQSPAEILQGAALAEAGAAERSLVTVRDPLVPGRLDVRHGERRAVPGQQQTGEDRVLRVVRAGRMLGDVARDPAPLRTDLRGPHVLGGRAQRVPHGESEQRAACPFAQTGGVPGRRDGGDAGDGSHSVPLLSGPRALWGCVPPEEARRASHGPVFTRSTSVRDPPRMSKKG